MARRAGYNGIIKVDLTTSATGTLTTAQFIGTWKIDMSRPAIDVTSFGDTAQSNVPGLPTQQVDFTGTVNLGTTQLSTLFDGQPRGLTLIPDNVNNSGVTFNGGTFYWSGAVEGDVAGAVKFTATGIPASAGAWTTGI